MTGNVRISFDGVRNNRLYWMTFWFISPAGLSQLVPGVYEDALRAPFQGSRPGLDVSGDGRGCNTLSGRFVVHEISFGAGGEVSSIAVDFEQHCEDGVAKLFGKLRFNSSYPYNSRVLAAGRSPTFIWWRRDEPESSLADARPLWAEVAEGTRFVDGARLSVNFGDTKWRFAGIGDFAADGNSDLLLQHTVDGTLALWLMRGTVLTNGTLVEPSRAAAPGWVVSAPEM